MIIVLERREYVCDQAISYPQVTKSKIANVIWTLELEEFIKCSGG